MADYSADLGERGYFRLPGLLSPPVRSDIGQWLDERQKLGRRIPETYQAEFEPVSDPGSTPLRKLRRLFWNDESFWLEAFSRMKLGDLVRRIVDRPVLIFHAAFLKPRRVGSPVGLHQDQAFWPRSYPGAVSLWVALDDASEENGALVGYPGSHGKGLLLHSPSADHPWHRVVDPEREGLGAPVMFDARAGDAVCWDRYFVHGSAANRSDKDRRGFVMVFASGAGVDSFCGDSYPLADL